MDQNTIDTSFYQDVISGLSRQPKELQCKYFYDERGSDLFDQICELEEYYLTRTERQIMLGHIEEMSEQLGEQVMLVEFGSGSSMKTRVLLDALRDPVAYVPLDISKGYLLNTAKLLQANYPHIEVLPLVADFTKSFKLPKSNRTASHAAVFFPGSTIGNFLPSAAQQMMKTIADILGTGGGMLIGIDLQKDRSIIEPAYNDAKGITDEFNLNVLHRINRELEADFVIEQFKHKAVYNETLGRVEIYIVSQCDQSVTVGDQSFQFSTGEEVLTEYSHKYTVDGFAELAAGAGFVLRKSWTDENKLFAILHMVNESK